MTVSMQCERNRRGFASRIEDPAGANKVVRNEWHWSPRLSGWPADIRYRDLPRRLALSGDRPLGRTAWSTYCVSPALPRSRVRFVPANDLRRSREYISREGSAVPRRRKACYFATVNYASHGSPTTSAIVRPDATLLSYQPYGQEGLLIADIDITIATGTLAARFRAVS